MPTANDSEFVRRQLRLLILRIGEWRTGRRSLNSLLGDFGALSAAIDSAEWDELTKPTFEGLEIANAMNADDRTPLNYREIEQTMQLLELAVAKFERTIV